MSVKVKLAHTYQDADYESAVERDLPGREDQLQYYLYALDRRAQSTREIIKAGAMKTTDLISLIEKTDYIDYMSLSTLYQKMHGLLVLPTLSLGNVGEHSSLSLKLQSGELPTEDVEDQAGVATVLIKITSKDSKHPASFPTYAFELGKLLGTDNSGSSPYTYQTGFVVIVNAFTKQAWAVLNSEDDLGDQLSGVGIFPGLSTVTTVVDFGKTIDELLNPTQHALSPKPLALSANSFKYQVATLTGLANELARLTDELMAEGADEAGTKNVTNTTSGLAGNIHTQGTVPVDVIGALRSPS